MHRPRPWVVAGAKRAVVVLLASALSAAVLHRDQQPLRIERGITADLSSGLITLSGVAATVVALSPPPPPPPPPPAPPPPAIVWPGKGALTGWFGEGRATHRHRGIDLQAVTGSAVVAAAAGVVRHAGPAPAGYSGYGTIVLIDHGEGITTMYAHLSGVAVRRGQQVVQGDRVGFVGSSGQVSAPHLHFEVWRNGSPSDPQRWLPRRG